MWKQIISGIITANETNIIRSAFSKRFNFSLCSFVRVQYPSTPLNTPAIYPVLIAVEILAGEYPDEMARQLTDSKKLA